MAGLRGYGLVSAKLRRVLSRLCLKESMFSYCDVILSAYISVMGMTFDVTSVANRKTSSLDVIPSDVQRFSI